MIKNHLERVVFLWFSLKFLFKDDKPESASVVPVPEV